nr:MAG TPA: hypothetical protein [Caudoviricetes sp.]
MQDRGGGSKISNSRQYHHRSRTEVSPCYSSCGCSGNDGGKNDR